ncbi:MAG TPA: DUF2721 domain-containing protein [Steroidobacteraceae bacterium]|nr:DUF2721 domain-containing protein [Steroidobacteraceae bacterium]
MTLPGQRVAQAVQDQQVKSYQGVCLMDIAHLIQSSVAPVFLLSGVAASLGVLTNRLSRIVDRARTLEAQLEGHPGQAPQLQDDLAVLARRAHYINVAISLSTIAALLVALVVVTLFANAFFSTELGLAIALLFVGAMVCLSAAFIAFFIEVRVAVAALHIGVRRG